MAKSLGVKYICSNCGAQSAAWTGRCSVCGEWNTITEQVDIKTSAVSSSGSELKSLSIARAVKRDSRRYKSGIDELDNVLGGGLVAGSVVLIAGQPGIGKSTMMLQLASYAAKAQKVLYVSGEESEHQVAMRAERLAATNEKLQLAVSSSTNDIAATISGGRYEVVIVDSIQAISVNELSSAAATISQITNSTQLIASAAKASHTAVIMVGHVTKEGSIAGPKVLEHLVDVVLQLEGERYGGFKILRSLKNRFGSTNESGIFEMTDQGLVPVDNPSAALLAERQVTDGSIVHAALEGNRPVLVEIQALVNTTVYGYPKRAASGVDLNRVNLLVAMLERRTKLKLSDKDIYINVVGGIKLVEPAADLALCMAIASAAKGMQLKQNAVVFGEVGLSGEVRHVPSTDKRIAEATKMGFDGAIGPKSSKVLKTILPVSNVRDALNKFLSKD